MAKLERRRHRRLLGALALGLLVAASCGDDGGGGGSGENAGDSCKVVADCYPGLDFKKLQGDVVCLDKVPGGYCTHHCTTDADCCAVPGECETGHPQVCAPFESTPDKYCFLSCEGTDVGSFAPDDYCDRFAYSGFGCRSTGGGSENRKICSP